MKKILRIAGLFFVVILDVLGVLYIVDALPNTSKNIETPKHDCTTYVTEETETRSPQNETMGEESQDIVGDSMIQLKVDEYMDKMKAAYVRFDEVADIYIFAYSDEAKCARGIDTLKIMAKCYNYAAPIVERVISGDITSLEIAREKFLPSQEAAYAYKQSGVMEPLRNFREAIQTLYLVPPKTKEKSEKFLKAVYSIDLGANTGNPIENVTTFIGLIEAKKDFIKNIGN